MKPEKVKFEGWNDCIRLSNRKTELIVTTEVGPRIIFFGFKGQDNMLYVSTEEKGTIGGNDWHIYGGHRLWHAPEVAPRTYSPDNRRVNYSWNGQTLTLTQDMEPETFIVKDIEITLSPDNNEVKILHRLANKCCWDIELAPWAITACSAGGTAIVPQEPYLDPESFLLPNRQLVLWAYTKMSDPRYKWGDKYILVKQDAAINTESKIGILNKQQWCGFAKGNNLMVKTFNFLPKAVYPDFGCNNEIYVCKDFLEIESLGPLEKIPPNGSVEHIEIWKLFPFFLENYHREDYLDQKIKLLLHP